MSFDIYSTRPPCETCGSCGEYRHIANATHNVNNMVEAMFKAVDMTLTALDGGGSYPSRSWGRWNGHRLADLLPHAEACQAWLRDHKDELLPLTPSNGWGSVGCLGRVLQAIAEEARENPNNKLEACG